MTPANASGTHYDGKGAAATLVMAKWLRLAAAPTFAIMALLTVVFDGSVPNALCSTADGLGAGGMAPMYLMMSVFHSVPWLNLISRR